MGEPAEVETKVLGAGLNRRRENRTLGGGLALGRKARLQRERDMYGRASYPPRFGVVGLHLFAPAWPRTITILGMSSNIMRALLASHADRDHPTPTMARDSCPTIATGQPRLLPQLRAALALKHLSPRTIEAYVGWVRRYIRFHGTRHPAELGGLEVAGFLSWLAQERAVSASTQTQAASALVFLYRDLLDIPLGRFEELVRARQPKRVPVVLTRARSRRSWPAWTAPRCSSASCCMAAASGCWRRSNSG